MKSLIRTQVSSTKLLGPDVCQIEFSAADSALPAYGPGDHIQVHLPDGLVRSYSLVGRWRNDNIYKIAVRRTTPSRGGSAFMHSLKPGDTLFISPPTNNFALSLSTNAPRFFLAGGIGITPLISMIEILEELDHQPNLYYAGRSEKSMPFVNELHALLDSRLHIAADDKGTRLDLKGIVSNLPVSAELYMCGPVGMLNAVKAIWTELGRDPTALRFETFAVGGEFPNASFSVTVPRLDLTLEVSDNETLLEALERVGVEPLYNCRKGECGLCAVEVISLEGTIDHRDVFYSAEQREANAAFCSCVSRVAGGKVSIDFP